MKSTPLDSLSGNSIDGLEFSSRAFRMMETTRSTPEGQRMITMRTGYCKKLVEELLPIARYVLTNYRAGRYISVCWLKGNQPFDAELTQTGAYVDRHYYPPSSFLEVTVAVHPKDYLGREALSAGTTVFGLDGLSRTEDGNVISTPTIKLGFEFIDEFAVILLERIQQKAKKLYPEPTVLVVQCMLNRLYLVPEWDLLMQKVSRLLPEHKFSEIFMYEPVCNYSYTIHRQTPAQRAYA